ncbi:MAG: hypothetical protein J5656_06995 [Clostridia bacterium]|nr:hypothetical protein [Clostridia bacterium]
MVEARKTLIKIGKIINKVLIALGALLFVLGIIGFIVYAVVDDANYLAISAGDFLGNGIWMLIFNIVALSLINRFEAMVNNGQDNVIKGNVFILIIGVLSWNPLYIIAAIFGFIVKDDINKANQKKEESADEQEAVVVDEAPAEAEVEATAEEEPFAEAEAEEEKKDEE